MYDVCAVSELGRPEDVDELNELHKKSDELYNKAFTCECWSVTFYGLFFAMLLIYIISVIFLWVGAAKLGNLPKFAFNGVQKVSKNMGKVA